MGDRHGFPMGYQRQGGDVELIGGEASARVTQYMGSGMGGSIE